LKKNKISKNWINRQRKDIYVRQSKIEGYRSRAVYKIIEIDRKFKILKKAKTAIDLGAAPGSWSQYLEKKIKNGRILSIDLIKFKPINNTHQIIGDFTDEKYKKEIEIYFNCKIDLVLSDMAVNTTGNKNLDSIVTGELCQNAMKFAYDSLNTKGIFVSKLFMGSGFDKVVADAKKLFKEVKLFKPLASRRESKESFIICKYLS